MQRITFSMMLAAVLAAALLAGCNRGTQDKSATEQIIAPVAQPAFEPVIDFVEFNGQTNAKISVVIQSRVTGYLVAMPFKEGDNVKKNDVLFEIDARPFLGQLAAAEAQVKAARSQKEAAESQLAVSRTKLVYARATNKRYQELAKEKPGAVSPRELDQYQALDDQAFAAVVQAEANVSLAGANVSLALANLQQPTLNVEWSKVRSPIDGHISRYDLTLGNLVNADSSKLTTVMSIDPMYVYFYMDEPTLLRIKQAVHEGKIRSRRAMTLPSDITFTRLVGYLGASPENALIQAAALLRGTRIGDAPVYMALQGEDGYKDPDTNKYRHEGTINFVDNQINVGTDSILVRGMFENTQLTGGGYLLVPGMFVKVRLPIGQEENRLLVDDKAILSEQGQKKIYIVNDKNIIEERVVTLGQLRDDGMRVVSGTGLGEKTWVVFRNLQQLRPNMEVAPQYFLNMPRLGVAAKPRP